MGFRPAPSCPLLFIKPHLLLQWFRCTHHNYLHLHILCLSNDVNPHKFSCAICVFLPAGQKCLMSSFTSATLSTIWPLTFIKACTSSIDEGENFASKKHSQKKLIIKTC